MIHQVFRLLFPAMLLAACSEGGGSEADPATQAVADKQDVTIAAADQTASAGDATGGDSALMDIGLGDPDAPVTMIEYASLTCPHCANVHINSFPEIKAKYVDTGKVYYVFRHFILNQPDFAASVIARCDGAAPFYDRIDFFFDRQRDWAGSDWQNKLPIMARRLGVSRAAYDACLERRDLQEYLLKVREEGREQYQVNATPTLIIDGEKFDGPPSAENLGKAIEAAL